MRLIETASNDWKVGRMKISGERESLHRKATPPPRTGGGLDEFFDVLGSLVFGLDRGTEKSWKPGGVASDSCAGVVVSGRWRVSEKAKTSGLFVWMMSWM